MRVSLSPAQPGYPKGLLDLQAPPTLRVSGALPERPAVCIVGSRSATVDALAYARTLAADLTEAGVCIWSGGAIGIDRAAHDGALAASGQTVVVLGGGLDCLYPPENLELFAHVARGGGALLSPFADDAPAIATRFLSRNRVLAAGSRLTVIVECAMRSGAHSTAAHARALGRPIAVVLQAPWLDQGRGTYAELLLGAEVVLGADSVLDILAREAQLPLFPPAKAAPELDPLTDVEQSFVDAIERGASHLDDLCEQLSLPAATVCEVVLSLTMRGHVVDSSHGLRPSPRSGKKRDP